MIETLFACLMLFFAALSRDPLYYIASGVFAAAAHLGRICDRLPEKPKEDW